MSITPGKSGFLLLDGSMNLIASNAEAVHILSYPGQADQIKQFDGFVSRQIRNALIDRQSPKGSELLKEYQSGRRRYICRNIQVDCNRRYLPQPGMVLILERKPTAHLALEEICKLFALTEREGETVELLVEGLTSKEIANRMAISPNTVKAFVRLVMVKMNVTTRSGIVGRLARPHVVGLSGGTNRVLSRPHRKQ